MKERTLQDSPIRIGWASRDITPLDPVCLHGQFHVRVSEGVDDPLTVTALALEGNPTDPSAQVVLVSCDVVVIPSSLQTRVRQLLEGKIDGLNPSSVVLNATHTHTGPDIRSEEDQRGILTKMSGFPFGEDLFFESPETTRQRVAEAIVAAVTEAWTKRSPGRIGYGLGQAVVGRNRRMSYADGSSVMYGNTSDADFRHVEGYEDHSLQVLGTWDDKGKLTGLMVNVPCPSQVDENRFVVSADFWHETREQLRALYGESLFVLPQCSAAGDLSPRPPWDQRGEERMLRLKESHPRAEIAARIVNGIREILPYIEKDLQRTPCLRHRAETIELPLNPIDEAAVEAAETEIVELRQQYEALHREIEEHPEMKAKPRWYLEVTRLYRRMDWLGGVKQRWELQRTTPRIPFRLHFIRLGEIAIATNPFEYYLDFGIQIKGRSPATQTFLVQLAGSGSYVPSPRAAAGGSYGAVPASNPIGPEGGQELAEFTLEVLRDLFASSNAKENL